MLVIETRTFEESPIICIPALSTGGSTGWGARAYAEDGNTATRAVERRVRESFMIKGKVID